MLKNNSLKKKVCENKKRLYLCSPFWKKDGENIKEIIDVLKKDIRGK